MGVDLGRKKKKTTVSDRGNKQRFGAQGVQAPEAKEATGTESETRRKA